MNESQLDFHEHNSRVLQAVAYLIEWAKHIITLGAALMVLSVTFIKDLAKGTHPPVSYILVVCLLSFYLSMLVAIWLALRLIRYAASTVLTTAVHLGSGSELGALQDHLRLTQRIFLLSLAFFAAVALAVLLAWAVVFSLVPEAKHPEQHPVARQNLIARAAYHAAA